MTGEPPIAFKIEAPRQATGPNSFETDPEARASRIFDMVGIMPDPRGRVPREETVELIDGVKAGDLQATEALIATRLNWMYTSFATLEAVRERADLEMEDILQIGCLAVTQAASELDTDLPAQTAVTVFNVETHELMARHVVESKLVPTVSARTLRPMRNTSRVNYKPLLADAAVMVGQETLSRHVDDVRNERPRSVENEVLALTDEDVFVAIDRILDSVLSARDVLLVKSYCGLTGSAKKNEDLARWFGVRANSVRTLKSQAARALHHKVILQELKELREARSGDLTNKGLQLRNQVSVVDYMID